MRGWRLPVVAVIALAGLLTSLVLLVGAKQVITGLVGASFLLTVVFALWLGPPWRSENPTGAWLWAGLAWSTAVFDGLLFLSLLRISVPIWIAIAALLVQDVVYTWRLFLLYEARRDPTVPPHH